MRWALLIGFSAGLLGAQESPLAGAVEALNREDYATAAPLLEQALEGDPDNVINRANLCSKGAGMFQYVENENRLTRPKYRAPYSKEWKTVSWDWALDQIADRIKKTRDAGFIHKNDGGDIVNRAPNMASMGSAALDNEECWLYQSLLRAMGLVYIEHQARL